MMIHQDGKILLEVQRQQQNSYPKLPKSICWETPIELFQRLDFEFGFTLDPCADESNHKCSKYFTLEENGLLCNWENERVYVNPPYGKEIPKWLTKSMASGADVVVLLLPAYVESVWFRDYVVGYAKEIRFITGRLRFEMGREKRYIAPFASMVVVYHPSEGQQTTILSNLDFYSPSEEFVLECS